MSGTVHAGENSMAYNTDDYDYIFKVVIIGEQGVGKSSLIVRFADDKFSDQYKATIGVDFKLRTVELDRKLIKMQMWDTAGQERFQSIASSFYRGANGFVLVYDITDERTFAQLPKWLDQIERYSGSQQACRLLIGNKVDLPNRQVDYSRAKKYADALDIPFLEASAKDSLNVDQAFLAMAAILKKREGDWTPHSDDSIVLKYTEPVQQEMGYCCYYI